MEQELHLLLRELLELLVGIEEPARDVRPIPEDGDLDRTFGQRLREV